MISRVQFYHFDLMTWFKTLQVHWIDIWNLQSNSQKSTVYWKVKLWLFGQIQVPKIIIHQKCQNMKLIHQEIKNSWFNFEKSKFLNLEIFLSVENSCFFMTLSQIFTMIQNDSRETPNVKVVDLHEIYNFASHKFS